MTAQLTDKGRNSGVTAPNGAIIRSTGDNTYALARADTYVNAQGIVGVVFQTTPSVAGASLQYAASGRASVLLISGLSPQVGQAIFLSSAQAGYGTLAPATYERRIGVIVDASPYATTGTVVAQVAIAQGSAAAVADWDASKVRYYAIDYVNGNDNNIGFIDADAGATFEPEALQAVALKTYEEFYARAPKQGAHRKLVCLIRGDADASVPITYYKKDGTTVDDVNIDGFIGFSTFLVRVSDFTNSDNDKRDMAGYQPTSGLGPGDAGVWTVGSYAAPVITVASGSIATDKTLVGMKLQWTGNVTSGLRTRCGAVKAGLTSSTLEISAPGGSSPAAGDTFTLRLPSVAFRTLIGTPRIGAARVAVVGVSGTAGPQICGMRFTPPSGGNTSIDIDNVTLVFTVFDVNLTSGLSFGTNGAPFNWSGIYTDETNTLISIQQTTLYDATDETKTVEHVCSGVAAGGNRVSAVLSKVRMTLNGFVGYGALLSNSAIHARILLQFCNLSMTSPEASVSIGSTSASSRLLARGESTNSLPCMELRSSRVSLNHVVFGPNGADGLLVGYAGPSYVRLDNCSGGPVVGYGVSCVTRATSDGSAAAVVVIGDDNTVAGPSGDFAINGAVLTWVQVEAQSFVDNNGNAIQPVSAQSFRRTLPDTWFQALAVTADPAATNPPAGYVDAWFRSDTNQFSVRKSDGTIIRVTLT